MWSTIHPGGAVSGCNDGKVSEVSSLVIVYETLRSGLAYVNAYYYWILCCKELYVPASPYHVGACGTPHRSGLACVNVYYYWILWCTTQMVLCHTLQHPAGVCFVLF